MHEDASNLSLSSLHELHEEWLQRVRRLSDEFDLPASSVVVERVGCFEDSIEGRTVTVPLKVRGMDEFHLELALDAKAKKNGWDIEDGTYRDRYWVDSIEVNMDSLRKVNGDDPTSLTVGDGVILVGAVLGRKSDIRRSNALTLGICHSDFDTQWVWLAIDRIERTARKRSGK